MCAYKALDVADYIVYYSNHTGKSISHLKLQKILYFIEAWFITRGKSIFNEEISKWKLGPVVEGVYHQYKTFGSGNITYVPKRLEIKPDGTLIHAEFDESIIKSEDKIVIESLIDKYIDVDPFTLVQITHEHELWKRDEINILMGNQGLKYDKSEIKRYFKSNPDAFEV